MGEQVTDTIPGNYYSRLSDKKLYLLRKMLFGISVRDYNYAKAKSVAELVEELINPPETLLIPPVKDYSSIGAMEQDIAVAPGTSWVKDFSADPFINGRRKKSLQNWISAILLHDDFSAGPRIFHFWMNFFGVNISKITYPGTAYNFYSLIHRYKLKNYKELLTQVILHKILGQYARKIKQNGEPVNKYVAHLLLSRYIYGPQYAEHINAVKQRRLLRLLNYWDALTERLIIGTSPNRADQLFDLEYFADKSEVKDFMADLSGFIDVLFSNPQAAKYLCVKVFNWFISYNIDATTEQKIIIPAAERLFQKDYDLKPFFKYFFTNDFLYNDQHFGFYFKSPTDFVCGIFKDFDLLRYGKTHGIEPPQLYDWARFMISQAGQEIGDFQEENALQGNTALPRDIWVDPASVARRNNFVENLLGAGYTIDYNNTVRIDVALLLRSIQPVPGPEYLSRFLLHFFFGSKVDKKLAGTVNNFLVPLKSGRGATATRQWDEFFKSNGSVSNNNAIVSSVTNIVRFILTQSEYQLA